MNAGLQQNLQFEQQRNTVLQINATKNAQRANQKGLPNRDTPRALARREWMRRARYQIESEGLRAFLKDLWKPQDSTEMSQSAQDTHESL